MMLPEEITRPSAEYNPTDAAEFAPLPDEFGTKLALDICNSSATGVLLLVKSEHYADITDRVSPSGVLTPFLRSEHSLMIDAAATSRVSSGFMNASPSALMSIAPTERTFSVTSAP